MRANLKIPNMGKRADYVLWGLVLLASIILWQALLPMQASKKAIAPSGPSEMPIMRSIAAAKSFANRVSSSCEFAMVAPDLPELPAIPPQPTVSTAAAWLKSEGARYGGTIREIPATLRNGFTLNGTIEVTEYIFDQPYLGGNALSSVWTYHMVEDLKKKAAAREPSFSYPNYPIYEALEKRTEFIRGKRGLVIGSEMPWAEATLLSFGAEHITTVEFGHIDSQHPQITTYTPSNFTLSFLEGRIKPFDFAFTYSSIEHDGLGRYGDLINPIGDLQTMAKLRDLVIPGGVVFFGAPCCYDRLEWNAHRVYGPARLPLLFAGYRVLGVYPSNVKIGDDSQGWTQPVWAVQNLKGCSERRVQPQLITV